MEIRRHTLIFLTVYIIYYTHDRSKTLADDCRRLYSFTSPDILEIVMIHYMVS
jgi:hypothetical protein